MIILDAKSLLFGMNIVDLEFCKHCVMSKHHRQAFDVEIYIPKN